MRTYSEKEIALVKAAMSRIEDIVIETSLQSESVGIALLNVMSALRGPDDEDCEAKQSGTNFVRHAAFPRISNEEIPNPWDTECISPASSHISRSLHFNNHVQLAFNALGIEGTE